MKTMSKSKALKEAANWYGMPFRNGVNFKYIGPFYSDLSQKCTTEFCNHSHTSALESRKRNVVETALYLMGYDSETVTTCAYTMAQQWNEGTAKGLLDEMIANIIKG